MVKNIYICTPKITPDISCVDGRERTTKPYIPFELIYLEECETRPEARIREKYWKSGTGKEKLRKLRDVHK